MHYYSCLEEATNKGIDPGRISNAVNYAAKNMVSLNQTIKDLNSAAIWGVQLINVLYLVDSIFRYGENHREARIVQPSCEV
jgi:hypothetical protein